MLAFYRFCFTLRRLSGIWRLFMVFLSFALLEALLVYLTVLGKERGFTSLLLPVGILIALLFPWAAALALEFFLLIVYLLINMALKGWNDQVIPSFVAGSLMDLFLVATIGLLMYAEEARQKEKNLTALKDQFITNIHHELRTPLTLLGGSLELLQECHEHMDPVKQTEVLTLAVKGYEELVSLVNRVLDTTMVMSEIPKASSEVVHVQRLVQEELAHLAPLGTGDYTIHLEVPEQVMVWADAQLLRQVLRNLLSNVLKYVPTQTEITISAMQADPSSPVCLSVQDAGPGIPAEELPLLFEKFVRLKRDLTGPTRGTGLGLYICKRLVEAMEGCIWVESSGRMGEGSRFCVALPAPSGLPVKMTKRPSWMWHKKGKALRSQKLGGTHCPSVNQPL
jgi:signal transduction histidine kinase